VNLDGDEPSAVIMHYLRILRVPIFELRLEVYKLLE